MKKLMLSLLVLCSFYIHAQQQILSDAAGRPISLQPYENVKGSAYLFDEWIKGNVTDRYGTTFLDVSLRFDIYANKLFFLHKDASYEFITDIAAFEIFPYGDTVRKMSFQKGFALPGKISGNKYVELLSAGRILLVKNHTVLIDEITEYNVPGKIRTFVPRAEIFITRADSADLRKPSQKLLEEMLADKWEPVKAFVTQHSLGYKKEADLQRIISYYNSL